MTEGADSADVVAGEARSVLREALLRLRTDRRPDADLELTGELPDDLAGPFLRAFGRVEAELRADDQARGGPVRGGGELRTAALMALILRVTDPG